MILLYVSHPEVRIDPAVSVPEWGLSDVGRKRAEAAARSPRLAAVRRMIASGERKAIETAEILAAPQSLTVEIRPGSHENDRSATGFLPGSEFQQVADQFFGQPEISVRGWERAIDAQRRIVREVEEVMATHTVGDVVMCGHGGVGTLLFCHYSGLPISRAHDQTNGGGNFLSLDIATRRMQHGWRPIEVL